MGLEDRLYSGLSSNLSIKGKQIKSDGRGGFGRGGFSRFAMGINSFNKDGGPNHQARAMSGNVSPNGLNNANTHYDTDDVEFDED